MRWNGRIWEGVYKKFAEAPNDSGYFEKEKWLKQEEDKCNKKIKTLKQRVVSSSGGISELAESKEYCLSIVISMMDSSKQISVLDFGGGLASIYFETIEKIVGKNIKFFIVENGSICKKGSELFKDDKKIEFLTVLPEQNKNTAIDIVHAGSSMHYVDDWIDLLDKFVEYRPKYLVFSDLPAGDINTFVTIQNHYDDKIPVRFWNLSEFVNAVEYRGFKLIYKTRFINGYIKYMKYFDKKYWLEHFSQLIFKLN